MQGMHRVQHDSPVSSAVCVADKHVQVLEFGVVSRGRYYHGSLCSQSEPADIQQTTLLGAAPYDHRTPHCGRSNPPPDSRLGSADTNPLPICVAFSCCTAGLCNTQMYRDVLATLAQSVV
jgi:hypothetical protein